MKGNMWTRSFVCWRVLWWLSLCGMPLSGECGRLAIWNPTGDVPYVVVNGTGFGGGSTLYAPAINGLFTANSTNFNNVIVDIQVDNSVWTNASLTFYGGAFSYPLGAELGSWSVGNYDMRADAALTFTIVVWNNSPYEGVVVSYVPPTLHGLFWMDFSQPTFWFWTGWGLTMGWYGFGLVLRLVRKTTNYSSEL